jgi:hypothetical protein
MGPGTSVGPNTAMQPGFATLAGQGFNALVPASGTKTSPVNGSTVIECALVVRRQHDGLQNGAVFADHGEEPSAVGAIITGDVELLCGRVEPQLVRTTEAGDRLDKRAVGLEQDRLRPHVAAANHHVAAPTNGESGRRARCDAQACEIDRSQDSASSADLRDPTWVIFPGQRRNGNEERSGGRIPRRLLHAAGRDPPWSMGTVMGPVVTATGGCPFVVEKRVAYAGASALLAART